MFAWSKGTWPDPLVDFGAQLYVPWQLSEGHVLYRDVAYYNGPLSSYINAIAFRLFGVGLNTLVAVNLLILAGVMTVAYRLTLRASGRWPAFIGGITFALVFAFGQVVPLGNYNWLTPYTHEVTHGTALGLAAIAAVSRHQRSGKKRWILLAGGLLGAVFLTKAEPTAASFAAASVLLISQWWIDRSSRRHIFSTLWLIILPALIVPLIAWMLLAFAMPPSRALRGVLGSWPWAMDHRITSLHFYREVAGLNDIPGNLLIMLKWIVVYAILIGGGVGLGLRCQSQRSRTLMTVTTFLLCSAVMAWQFSQTIVPGMITPLPLCLCLAAVVTAIAVFRRSSPVAPLRFALVIFSAVLIAKMGLTPFAYHYGFVLAWPATVVLICAVTDDLPRWVDRHGGAGQVVRAVGLAAWLAGVGAILYSDKINFDQKQSIIAVGTPDEFRSNGRGREVQQVCDRIHQLVPSTGTVLVLPQGLMINYLTRRASPTRFTNFMPPEVITAGEANILSALSAHAPDAIVLTPAVIEDGHFTLDDRDPYGADTLKWVSLNYVAIDPVDPTEVKKRLVIMVRRAYR